MRCRISAKLIVLLALAIAGMPTASSATDAPGTGWFDSPAPEPGSVIARLFAGQYAALGQEFSDLEADFLAGKRDEREIVRAWLAFENSDPAIGKHLDRWVATDKSSFVALAARGVFLTHLGWISRGDSLARDLRDEQAGGMHHYFDAAARDLTAAVAQNPRLGIGYAFLIENAMVRGGDTGSWYSLGRQNVPQSAFLRDRYRYALRPEWFGSAPDALRRMKIARWKRDSRDDARQWPAVAVDPGSDDYHAGRTLELTGNDLAAVQRYDAAISQSDKNGNYYYFRGWLRFQQQDYDAAKADFEQAVALTHRFGDGYKALSGIAIRQQDWQAGAALLRKALKIDPYHPIYLRNYAQALRYAHEKMLPPDPPDAPKGRELPEARCLPDGKAPYETAFTVPTSKWTAASWRHHCGVMAVFDRALVYGAGDPALHDQRADHLTRILGRPDLALADSRAAMQAEPKVPRYVYQYGLNLYDTTPCHAVPYLIHYIRMCAKGSACRNDAMAPIWLTDIADNAGCDAKVTAAADQYRSYPKEYARCRMPDQGRCEP